MVIPTLTAASYVLAAVGRRRALAATLILLGPTYVVALVAIRSRSPLRTLWGLHLGVAAAVAAALIGVALLVVRPTRHDTGTVVPVNR